MGVDEVSLDILEVAPEEVDALTLPQVDEATKDGPFLIVAHSLWDDHAISVQISTVGSAAGPASSVATNQLIVYGSIRCPYIVCLRSLLRRPPLFFALQLFLLLFLVSQLASYTWHI